MIGTEDSAVVKTGFGRKPRPVLLMVRELGIGGCERDLTRAALVLDRTLFEPHVACFHEHGLRGDELRHDGVPILHLPVRSLRSVSAVRGACLLGQYLHRHNIQLVHAFDVPMTIFGIPLARFYRTPVVIASQLGYRRLHSMTYRHALRVTDPLADRIVVNCEALRRHLVEDEKVPSARTFLCYNGVDTSVFSPSEEARPRALAGASAVIGTICALRPEKRLDMLLDAFARLRRLDKRLKLLIVGSGTELPALERQRDRLQLGEACVFEPATGDVVRWMRCIDIFVLTSISEGFPNALLEALATGCGVIASRVGGVPELVEHGQNGLLFENRNIEDLVEKLGTLTLEPGLRCRLSKTAVQIASERFSADVFRDRLQELYLDQLRRAGIG